MSIPGRHFYRFTYLKSDHWQNLRLEKLVEVDAHCYRCDVRDLSNDVHHVNYRKLFDVMLSDLIVLCRTCHDLMHEALDAAKSGDSHTALLLVEKLRLNKGINQPLQLGRALQKLRKSGLLEKPVAEEPPPIVIERQAPIAPKRLSAPFLVQKLGDGFGNPLTKPLFMALRKTGFIADLQAEYPG